MFKIVNSLFSVALIVVLLVAGLSFFNVPIPITYKIYAIISQSMEPTLKKGDLIVVQKKSTYKKGDVITFYNPKGFKKTDTITHRISRVFEERGNKFYKTKGDANNVADGWRISDGLILGSFTARVPYLGGLVSFSKTSTGFLLLIVLPAIIIIASELNEIKRELLHLIHKDKKNVST